MSILGLKFQKRVSDVVSSNRNPIVFPHGKNLFNKDTITPNSRLMESGNTTAESNYHTSDYIPVIVDATIKFSHTINNALILTCFYDIDKNLISGATLDGVAVDEAGGIVVAKGAYMRTTFQSVRLNIFQIEYGTSTTDYEAFSPMPSFPNFRIPQYIQGEPRFIPSGRNLFNKDAVTPNFYLNSSGMTVSGATFGVSDYIPVIEGSVLHLSNVVSTAAAYVHFYDVSKKLIPGGISLSDLSLAGGIVVAKGVYMRVSLSLAFASEMRIGYGKNSTEYEPYTGVPSLPNFANPQEVIDFNKFFKQGKNLFDKRIVSVDVYLRSNGTTTSSVGYNVSNYIPVLEGTYLKFSNVAANANIHTCFYDINKVLIPGASISHSELLAAGGIVMAKGMYMRTTIATSQLDTLQIEYGKNSTEYEPYTGVPSLPNFANPQEVIIKEGTLDSSVLRVTDRYTYGQLIIPANNTLLAVYENHVLVSQYSDLKYSNKGIKGEVNLSDFEIINISTFPNIHPDSSVSNAAIFNSADGMRSIIITNKNQIYHSTNGVFDDFQLSDIWTMPGEEFRHHSIDANDKDPTGSRYRYYMPYNSAARSGQFSWFNGLQHLKQEAEGTISRDTLVFGNYQLGTLDTFVPACLFSTYDGKNIYIQYMFGYPVSRALMAGTETYRSNTVIGWGDELDTSSFSADYTGGLKLVRRDSILPSSHDTKPVDSFVFRSEISVTSIARAVNPVITLDSVSEFEVGSCVAFRGNANNDDWNSLTNLEATTNHGGNGRFYMITGINGNTVTLSEAIGNPNNPLLCRHIHYVNKFANGVVVGTGENYPQSWSIWNNVYPRYQTSPRWQEHVRLNSSENALSRAIGILLAEGDKILFASDETKLLKNINHLEVGGTPIISGTGGMWYGSLSDFDDASKFENKLWDNEEFFKLVDLNGVIFACTLGGRTFLSFDRGKTFEHVWTGGGSKQLSRGWDKGETRWFFSGGSYIELK